jgi:hypothetical protein
MKIECLTIEALGMYTHSTMKVQTLQGVPYTVNEKGDLLVYGSEPTLQIGTYDQQTKEVVLVDKWQQILETWLTEYRAKLKLATQEAMKRALELQKN